MAVGNRVVSFLGHVIDVPFQGALTMATTAAMVGVTLCTFIILCQPGARRNLRGVEVVESVPGSSISSLRHDGIANGRADSVVGSVKRDGDGVDEVHGQTRRRQAAIILFGRVVERLVTRPRDPKDAMLRRVRRELLKYVIEPNAQEYNFTSIVRLDGDDAAVYTEASIREQFADNGTVVVSDANPLTINEPSVFGCGYRMWTNIEMAVRRMRALEIAYGAADPVRWGRGFDMVLIMRAEVHINTVFELNKLNPALFYMANFCSPVLRRGKNKVSQVVTKASLACLPNETLSIPPTLWPRQRQVRPSKPLSKPCSVHRLECRVLQSLGAMEAKQLTMPDYFFIGNSTTMREMFEFIVEDWHQGKFRKSAGHCNHGVLGGRLFHKIGRVRCGRYLYHKIDVEIPRLASWYPSPSLHEYLNARGALWRSPVPYNIAAERFSSVCGRTVCTIPDAEAFNG